MAGINSEYDFENASCGFLSFTAEGKITYVNKTLATWLHHDEPGQLLDHNLSTIIGRGAQLYFQLHVFPILTLKGFVNELSLDLVTANQTTISCLFNASAIKNDTGGIGSVHAILFSISERKRYEAELVKAKAQAEHEKQQFEFLANTLPNILWTASPTGELTFSNHRFIDYFGRRLQNSLSLMMHDVVLPDDMKSNYRKGIRAARYHYAVHCEVRIRGEADEYRWFVVNAIPCFDGEHNLVQWLGTCADIQLHKEKQEKLVDGMSEKLSSAHLNIQHKDQTLQELAFIQAHLVRSPVAQILGLVSLLPDTEVSKETAHIISLIRESTMQLDNVVSGMVHKATTQDLRSSK
jgi:PAS domain-containing protein